MIFISPPSIVRLLAIIFKHFIYFHQKEFIIKDIDVTKTIKPLKITVKNTKKPKVQVMYQADGNNYT